MSEPRAATFRRYLAYQAPGWVVFALAAWAATYWPGVPALAAAAALVAWVAKDLVLFRFVGDAYRRGVSDPSSRLIGRRGVWRTAGWVEIGPERWRAESAEPIERGTRVRVVAVEGLVLRVEPEGDQASDSSNATPSDAISSRTGS